MFAAAVFDGIDGGTEKDGQSGQKQCRPKQLGRD